MVHSWILPDDIDRTGKNASDTVNSPAHNLLGCTLDQLHVISCKDRSHAILSARSISLFAHRSSNPARLYYQIALNE